MSEYVIEMLNITKQSLSRVLADLGDASKAAKDKAASAKETLFGGESSGDLPVTALCLRCHSAPGIHSIKSRSGLFHNGILSSPPAFQPSSRARLDAATTEVAAKFPGWMELRKLWPDAAGK